MRVSFQEFTLDRSTRQLLRAGEELHLEPKAFELLDLLLRRRPDAVSKQEIRDHLWPDTFVSESNLTGLVTQIRQALADDPRRPRFVRTIHGFGYAFPAEVSQEGSEDTAKPRPAPRLVWERRVMPLEPGENILGRGDDVTVRIDVPGVSRRHARIVVQEGGATLEDLGSKNGTFLRERRLGAPAQLADGDTVRLGRQLLIYRQAPLTQSTLTEGGE